MYKIKVTKHEKTQTKPPKKVARAERHEYKAELRGLVQDWFAGNRRELEQ